MLRYQHGKIKLKNTNKQDSTSNLEDSNHIVIGPEKNILAEAQEWHFKIAIINILNDPQRNVNEWHHEDCENMVNKK